MKKIALYIFEDAVLSSLSGAIDLLYATNAFLVQQGKEPAFDIMLVSQENEQIPLRVPATIAATHTIDQVQVVDLILLPAFYGNAATVLGKNERVIAWIKDRFANGTEVASLCFGSFFLAEAGLLNGKSCASHWLGVNDMRSRYPQVDVLADVVITDNDGIYTSGGALLSWNLLLYLVEKFCGPEVSIGVSKMFNLDPDKFSQSHFVVFQGQRSHEDHDILQAQTFIENNFHSPITTEQLAALVNMSKRNFIRRFKNATNNTPLEYLQRVKIEAVKKALEHKDDNVLSLMYDAGYNDVKTFRKVFKQITGLTPQEYRRKYSRKKVLG